MSKSLSEHAGKLQKQALQWLSQSRSRIDQDINFGVLELFTPKRDIPDGFLGDKPTGFSTTLYSLFPFLFYELFPQVPLESYQKLSLCISLYLDYMVMMDKLMDNRAILEPNVAFWLTSIQQKAITLLATLFPPDSPLWPYFDRCRRENTHALILERVNHTFRLSPYSEEEMILIAAGKSAMAKAGIAALAFLADAGQLPSDLISSCDAWHVGFQMFDDLRDWRTDYLAHMYSPLLTQVILDNELAEKVEAKNRLDVNVIGSLIYSGDYGQEAMHNLPQTSSPAETAANLPQRVAVVSPGVACRPYHNGGNEGPSLLVFNSRTGRVIRTDIETARLLDLCDGQASVGQIANRLARQDNDLTGYLKAYYQTLSLAQSCVQNGVLELN